MTRLSPEPLAAEFRPGLLLPGLRGARLAFAAIGALMVMSLVAAYLVSSETIRATERVAAHEAFLQRLRQTFSTVQDAETGQRGFLLTRQEEYLRPYEAATARIADDLREAERALAAGERPEDRLARFRGAVTTKLEELERTIGVAREEGFEAALRVVQAGTGRMAMDNIRAGFADLQRHETARIEALREQAARLQLLRRMAFTVLIAANVGCLFWAYRRLRGEVRLREVADLEAERHRDFLAVSLASIADGVILADPEGRVTFLNDAGAQLTGWAPHEAIGQPCAEVFRTLDPATRQRRDDLVSRVLASDEPARSGDHSLLLRRDQSELPIDDCAAPVRDGGGRRRGVILVFRDFSAQQQARREQEDLRRRLEQADQAKDDFLAALSHELRTPLTPVLATLSAWRHRGGLAPELFADVDRLERNVRLETRLIDDLLDLTRVSRGELALEWAPVDIHALLGAVVAMFREPLEARRVRLGLRLAATRPFVHGDAARLQQVFWNVLGNSAKFTPDDGRIEVVTGDDGDAIRVTFADNGRGMSEATLAVLFRPFERAAPARSYRSGGLGIGLAISKSLLDAHGGSIEARSPGPGLGSTFVVRLPALAEMAVAPPGESAPVPTEPPAALSLLLVEDHVDSAEVLARILRQLGHRVSLAGTVGDALNVLRADETDLVLTDIGLPDGSGLDLIARAREFTSVPMVAITGYGMPGDLERYGTAGFEEQLTKPVAFDQLEGLLARYRPRARS